MFDQYDDISPGVMWLCYGCIALIGFMILAF